MKNRYGYMHILVAACAAAIFAACASIGRPEGGPRDETPPVFVKSVPSPNSRNVKNSKIDIYFDENVQVKDVVTKLVVSPPQKEMPAVTAGGKKVSVELKDTLKKNVTYTVDFADAISDLNEGNIYDGFAIDFSTGNDLDSLRISGILLDARNLEPAQSILVGVHSNLDDSALTTLPFDRITRTNQLGQFTIRGLKPGDYRVYAVNDVNRDYMWNRSEDVAFYDVTVSPWAETIMVTDTLLDANGNDSTAVRPGTAFLPNDLLLTWFNEGYKAQYLNNYSRPDSGVIELSMAAKSDTLPVLKIVSGKNAGKYIDSSNSILEAKLNLDTLKYWITDPEIWSQDSLKIETRYLKTDSTDNLSWTVDTLNFFYKRPKEAKENKKKKKKDEEEENDSVPQINFVDLQISINNEQDVNKPVFFTTPVPLDTIFNDMIHLEQKIDSAWVEVELSDLVPDTIYQPLKLKAFHEWEPEADYRLKIDSLAVRSINGEHNKTITKEFKVKSMDDYSTIIFNIAPDTLKNVIVELLNPQDAVVATAPAIDGRAEFPFLTPAKYYARAFIDKNGNGKWDTGNISEKNQPEEVYYCPQKIEIKKTWTKDLEWNLFEIPVDLQKPLEIKKNKPKKKEGEQSKEENEEEEDDWNSNYIPGSQYDNAKRNNP